MTRYYLDTEFNEDGRTIELISIALVCEDGRELYLVSNDFERDKCNDWVREHVLPQLPPRVARLPRSVIARKVMEFVRPDPEIDIWAYYADYDWVALCQLFGTMIQLPEHFPMLCLDLKQLALSIGIKDSLKELVPMPKGEHDALEDARWNLAAHRALMAVADDPSNETLLRNGLR